MQAQDEQCRALAARLGYLVIAVFCDNDVSAYSGRPRPQYLKMLELLRSGGADVVLVWHTDRLHRPVYRCQQTGGGHVSIPVAPVDKLAEKVGLRRCPREPRGANRRTSGGSCGIAGRDRRELRTTVITLAEIRYGIARLPDGRRKQALLVAADEIFRTFGNQVLPVDADAAGQYSVIASTRERSGKPIPGFGALIAAVCRSRGAALATRNLSDFDDTGVELVDPWSAVTG